MSGPEFVLGDRYRLVSPLGEGGMARVYAAVDERLNRRVAVKVLAERLAGDEEFVQRFQREAEAAAKLSHPNIIAVHDVGQDNGWHYIVMELVAGRSLKDFISERAMPDENTVAIAMQVLQALGYAHGHNIIHRDIKPQNIMVAADGMVKLADFGIARAVDASSATQTAVVLGSAHYFSPEQASGEPLTFASDLYSVGVVMFEMSTGSVPFQGSNLLAVATQHLHETAPDAAQINPQISNALRRVIARALEKDPRQRYQTAEEMLEDLAGAVAPPSAMRDETLVSHPVELLRSDSDSTDGTLVTRPSMLLNVLGAIGLIILAIAAYQSPAFMPASTHGRVLTIISLVLDCALLAVAAASFGYGVWSKARLRFCIDPRAVTVETGVLSHHRDAIPLPAIVNLQLHQNPVSRVFGLGTLLLTTAQLPGRGSIELRIRNIRDAVFVYDFVLDHVSKTEQGAPIL
jgi:serine/threonine protein kinase